MTFEELANKKFKLRLFRTHTRLRMQEMADILGFSSRQSYQYWEDRGRLPLKAIFRLNGYLETNPKYVGTHRLSIIDLIDEEE